MYIVYFFRIWQKHHQQPGQSGSLSFKLPKARVSRRAVEKRCLGNGKSRHAIRAKAWKRIQ